MITENAIIKIEKTLSNQGWRVVRRRQRARVPDICVRRYAWLPEDVTSFVCTFDTAVNPGDQAWLVTWRELAGQSDSAFAWDEWKKMSLKAAEDDPGLQASIRSFWDEHFPILLSLKSGYGYIAIGKDLTIVAGDEPEFEETAPVCEDFRSFLKLLTDGTNQLGRWI
jgi:hypothetical protein